MLSEVVGRICEELSVTLSRLTVVVCALVTPVRFTVMVLPLKVGLPATLPVPPVTVAFPLTTVLLKVMTMVWSPPAPPLRHSTPGDPESGRAISKGPAEA